MLFYCAQGFSLNMYEAIFVLRSVEQHSNLFFFNGCITVSGELCQEIFLSFKTYRVRCFLTVALKGLYLSHARSKFKSLNQHLATFTDSSPCNFFICLGVVSLFCPVV